MHNHDTQRSTAQPLDRAFAQSLLDTTPTLVISLDLRGCVRRCNRAAQTLTGVAASSLLGQPFWPRFAPDLDVATPQDTLLHAGAAPERHPFSTALQCADGRVRLIDWTPAPFNNDAGEPELLLIGQEITAQETLRQRLATREVQLRSLLDATPDIIWLKDGAGRWLETSRSGLALFQLEGTDYRGRSDRDLADSAIPLYRDAFLACEESDEEAWRAGGSTRIEENIPLPDGTRRIFDIIKSPVFDEQGERRFLVVFGRDITRIKQVEEDLIRRTQSLDFLAKIGRSFAASLELESVLGRVLREALTLLDATSNSSWIYEPEHDELVCRNAIGPSSEVLRGQRLKLGVGITGVAAARREVILVQDTRDDQRHFKRIDAETGVEVRSLIALPLLYQETLQGVLVCVDDKPNSFDAHDQQLLEALAGTAAMAVYNARQFSEMVSLRDQADAANRAKSTFLANMSHELRTPLNAVLGYSQILIQEAATSAEQRSALRSIHNAGNYLLTLINDILDLAKIEAGRFELFPSAIDPRTLFQQVHEQFQFRTQQKGLSITLEGLERLPRQVELDEKRLRQIVMNLLGNAVKFTEEGGITVSVDYQGERLQVAVSDTGIGIAQNALPLLFSPYSQSGEAKYRRQGTGLGLAISKSLVERMGGRIEVSSRLGQGSRFSFALHAPSVGGGDAPCHTPAPRRITGYRRSDGQSRPLYLLVVDDNEANREVLCGLLKPLGLRVATATTGAEALAQVDQCIPDLVFMDMVMPDMDGIDATRQLLASYPGLRIVAASAMVFAEDRHRAQEAGCVDFLPKPVQWEALIQILSQQLPMTWRYAEAEAPPLAPSATGGLDLRALDSATLEELKARVVRGNGRALKEFATHLMPDHPALAQALLSRIDEYEFEQILRAIDAAR